MCICVNKRTALCAGCYTYNMINRRTLGGITWIDLESPTQHEIRPLLEEFRISAPVAEELLLPTVRPRMEMHPHFIYVILHFPALRHAHKEREQELDFVVGKDFIITARYDTIDSLHKFSKVFEVNSVLEAGFETSHGGHIFYFMLKKMYKAVEHEISAVHDALLMIEQHVFDGREREMVAAISRAGRDILDLRQSIEPHRDVLRDVESQAPQIFGADFAPYLKNLSHEYYRVHNHIMSHMESMHELRETNNSLLTTKQNEIIKVLTVMAFITFPLSVIVGLFGMNLHSPLSNSSYGFEIVLAIMAILTFLMFTYFKRKRWL